ncbi:TBPIP-domain-containing protein [Phlebopus sp. FC_14]|nr:TBPIP-domain-containing protein [Phlebopus sp. FC_14]
MKAKNTDVKVLKGQEAEDAILQYMKRMNRPFGAVDIAANLKGAVPKATTAKILVTLAEKGEIVQKTYGKTNFYVANQANIDTCPPEELTALEEECKAVETANNLVANDVKYLTSELGKLKSAPTDEELDLQIDATNLTISELLERLRPLRNGVPLISAEALASIDSEWTKWRQEWVRRRKVFTSFWQLATDTLSPQDAAALAEDLGIEMDTPEHATLERSPICATSASTFKTSLKRKRE